MDAYQITITPAAAELFDRATAATAAQDALYSNGWTKAGAEKLADEYAAALDGAAVELGVHSDDIMAVYNLHRGLPVAIGKTGVRMVEAAPEAAPAAKHPLTGTMPNNFRPAYKTVTKAEITWTLQFRRDARERWTYVSDHGSEEDATLRAQGLLAEMSNRQFRVVERRVEVLVTDVIQLPHRPEGSQRYVVQFSEDGRNTVMDTETGTPVFSSYSRYAVTSMARDLNSGVVVVDKSGDIVLA